LCERILDVSENNIKGVFAGLAVYSRIGRFFAYTTITHKNGAFTNSDLVMRVMLFGNEAYTKDEVNDLIESSVEGEFYY